MKPVNTADLLLDIINIAKGLEIICRHFEDAGGKLPAVITARVAHIHTSLEYAKAEAEGIIVKDVVDLVEADVLSVYFGAPAPGAGRHYYNPNLCHVARARGYVVKDQDCDHEMVRRILAIIKNADEVDASAGDHVATIEAGRLCIAYLRDGTAVAETSKENPDGSK